MKKILENVLLLTGSTVRRGEVFFSEKAILAIADSFDEKDVPRIDGRGLLLLPSLVDVHVHLRDPGLTRKETIETGTLAAAKGGFLHIFPMPNVDPCPDDVETGKYYLERLRERENVHCHPYASLTENQKGKTLVDMKALYGLGFHRFSDDGGESTEDEELLKKAFSFSEETGAIISLHCEDKSLERKERILFEGEKAEKLGFHGGMTNEAESTQAAFYIEMARRYGGHIHICHVSAKQTIEAIAKGKREGVDVTGEATCHHLTLTQDDVLDTNFKMSPPLKRKEDRDALVQALKDGTIDFIASDHAPHTEDEKKKGWKEAPFGIVSLETSLPVLYTDLVLGKKALTLPELIERMAKKPAERFGLRNVGSLSPGQESSFFLFDPEEHYRIEKADFLSKGRNTPYQGKEVQGRVVMSFVNGNVVYRYGKGGTA